MKIKELLIISLIIFPFRAKAQVGNNFPILTGKTLTDKTITIPSDTKNKFTLVGMAYSQKSDEYLKKWMQPIFDTFINKSSLFNYDVNMYFIPMIGGLKQVAGETIEKRLKKEVDPQLHANVLFYKGNISDYKKNLNFDGKDKPYFFIIDKSGKIVYATSGEYTDKKMDEIEEHLTDSME